MTQTPSTLTADQARAALDTIREIELETRRAIGLAGGGAIMMIWGIVWLAGYLGSHWLAGPASGALWAAVDLVGLLGTGLIVARVRHRVRAEGVGRRIGLFWLALFTFTGLVIWLVRPGDGALLGLLIAIFMMFGYVIMGVFVDRVFSWVGIGVIALAVAGYLLQPAAFGLWMALLCGGALFGSGLYVHLRWR